MAKQTEPAPAKSSAPPIRYRVTIEDLHSGAVTSRTGYELRTALMLAAEAHDIEIRYPSNKEPAP